MNLFFEIPSSNHTAILIITGLSTEGLFRISPSRNQLEDVITAIDQGKVIDWSSYEVHVAAGIIKNYLRELPDPLLSHSMFDKWIELEGSY